MKQGANRAYAIPSPGGPVAAGRLPRADPRPRPRTRPATAGGRRRLQVPRRPDRRRQVHRRAWPARTTRPSSSRACSRSSSAKGLGAIDSKKPIGLYARINADDPQASEVVLLVPVASEDGLVSLLKNMPNLTVKDKDADGVYKVDVGQRPLPGLLPLRQRLRLRHRLQNKDAIAKDRLLAPDKVLPAQGTSLASLTIHADAIPEKYKDLAISRGGAGPGPGQAAGGAERDAGPQGVPPGRPRPGGGP